MAVEVVQLAAVENGGDYHPKFEYDDDDDDEICDCVFLVLAGRACV